MENGDKIAVGSEVGENKSVEVEVVEERVVEGSNGLKDDAEDEVFEEAIETQENLQEQGSKNDLVDAAAVGEERKAEMVGGLGLDSLIESPNVENFEEAIEFHDEVGKSDGDDGEEAIVAGEVKVENMVGKNSADEGGGPGGIDDGQTIKEVVSEETNGLTDDELVGSQEDGVKEVTQVGAGGGIAGLTGGDEAEKVNFESNGLADDGSVGSQDVEVKEVSEIITGAEVAGLTDADEVDSKPDTVLKNEEPERNDIECSTSEPVPTDEKLDTEDLDSPQVTEFTKEILKEAGNSQELEDNSLSIENQDEKTMDLASASDGVPLKLQDDNGVEL
ncbi:hypothetical protein C1H46_013893 [Malus baccata]|uniref:Uncharacterized protein n=1 Tax=Malus baccata TaxID=106549 RepID=A0A540MNT6_MALBA|nr:hypothetical protein C1H46_013893 [Malus baccata]